MTDNRPDPSRLMDIGMGFWPAKTLLSAVELDLFSQLGAGSMSGDEIGDRLGLHPRGIYDFLDALVALKILEREGDGTAGRYRNGVEAAAFLDKTSPTYAGGFLEMANARLYGFWGDLTEALKTGRPQNEIKLTGKPMFAELYRDPARLEQFLNAMSAVSAAPFRELAERVDFARYRTLCDVGGANGQLCMTIARRHSHLQCTTFDLPEVGSVAEKVIEAAGLSDRIAVVSGDFFADPFPRADVITMGMILHDWNLERKRRLIAAAYEALPPGGAFIAVEHLIDDARRENAFALMMSLNMLVEFGDAFDFTGRDFDRWCREAGFRDVEILPLTDNRSVGIAHK